MIVVAFIGVGRILRDASRRRYRVAGSTADGQRLLLRPAGDANDRAAKLALAWALGVSLFVHCVVFIGVSYFGQVLLVWYVGLGFIGSLTPTGPRRSIALSPTGPRLSIAHMPRRSGPQTRHPSSGPQTRHPLGPHPVPA